MDSGSSKIKDPKQDCLGLVRMDSESSNLNHNLASGELKVKCLDLEQGELLKQFIFYLKDYLQKKIWLLCVNDNGEIGIFQGLKRGTKRYSVYLEKRFKKLNNSLKREIKINGNKTNAVFLTLTIAENSVDSVLQGVKRFKPYVDKVRKDLKKLGFGFKFFWVREFQKRGSLHYHLIIVLGKSFHFRKDKETGKTFILSQKLYNKLFEIFNQWGLGFVSLEPVSSFGEIKRYLAKYIIKGLSEIETEIENFEIENFNPENLTENFIKRVYAYAYALIFKFRLFGSSRWKLDIIYTYNNSVKGWGIARGFKLIKTFKNWFKLVDFVLKNWGIVLNEPPPSGELVLVLLKNSKN
jgi:hypothetical protein